MAVMRAPNPKAQSPKPKTRRRIRVRRAAVVVVGLALMTSLRPTTARAQTPPAAQGTVAAAAAAGRTLYAKTGCETCHGPDGRGTAAGSPLAATGLQLPAFIAYVRKPAGTMPPHSAQVVSDRSLADIHAFLRTAAPATPPAQGISAPAGRVEAGAAIYRKTGCFQCHVNEGQGGANGPRIGPDPIPFARFVQYVRYPTGEMPPYTEKVLSTQDLADIYAFLQARPRPPAVSTIPQLAP
jgi:mono/diheme cytochrome c family protein